MSVTVPSALTLRDTPLIPRAVLFGNPVKRGVPLSPNGKWLSWPAPVNGVLNVWGALTANPREPKALAQFTDRPTSGVLGSGTSEQELFAKDNAGDENAHLYRVNVITGQQQDCTPLEQVAVQLLRASSRRLDEMLVGINNRDPRWHEAYVLNLKYPLAEPRRARKVAAS